MAPFAVLFVIAVLGVAAFGVGLIVGSWIERP